MTYKNNNLCNIWLHSSSNIVTMMMKHVYVVLLHNFRTHYVGLNQIATVFNPLYEQYVNIENYDRIARYYDNNY
jgi:hypothetical protein